MTRFTWYDGPVPGGVTVRQVHGWLADRAGRVLVQHRTHEGKYLLPGGHISPADTSWAATLVREADEESQVAVDPDTVTYLGYQIATGDPLAPEPYAQVRLLAVITRFGQPRADPDSGHRYRRLMTSIPRAAALLDWGEPGTQQASAAAQASRALGFPVDSPAPESYA